ncbi:hypothetical protein [Streptomyces graminilatus]|uniref:hypothetical protein n=1 Tax=Streptomyces graminilatus TaxID=1464070 RepID=UPI0006E1F192|nr:hypothetical protein [Streptomyces graminilatus]
MKSIDFGNFAKRAALVACASATAAMAFAVPASAATTLHFYANGPADWSRNCDMTTKASGTYTYYEHGPVVDGHQPYAGGFDASESDLCGDSHGAVLHLTYFKWTGTKWVPATADPIKVTTGAHHTETRSWTFKDVRDVKVSTCMIDSAGALSSCTPATFY